MLKAQSIKEQVLLTPKSKCMVIKHSQSARVCEVPGTKKGGLFTIFV
jgi:hypothetical protein